MVSVLRSGTFARGRCAGAMMASRLLKADESSLLARRLNGYSKELGMTRSTWKNAI